jgi:hypothetical protein
MCVWREREGERGRGRGRGRAKERGERKSERERRATDATASERETEQERARETDECLCVSRYDLGAHGRRLPALSSMCVCVCVRVCVGVCVCQGITCEDLGAGGSDTSPPARARSLSQAHNLRYEVGGRGTTPFGSPPLALSHASWGAVTRRTLMCIYVYIGRSLEYIDRSLLYRYLASWHQSF